MAASELPIILFATVGDWGTWLEQHGAASPGLWLRLAKKGSGVKSITYAEALEVALCHGWIDGQKRAHDEQSWLQRFTPRGKKSLWSRINCEKAEALMESGQMRDAGLATVRAAKLDGRWEAAYEPQSRATIPEDFQAALTANPRAAAFFETLSGAKRYAVLFRIQTARTPEARARRIQEVVVKLENGEGVHPQPSQKRSPSSR